MMRADKKGEAVRIPWRTHPWPNAKIRAELMAINSPSPT
jgi:hypothetical protein